MNYTVINEPPLNLVKNREPQPNEVAYHCRDARDYVVIVYEKTPKKALEIATIAGLIEYCHLLTYPVTVVQEPELHEEGCYKLTYNEPPWTTKKEMDRHLFLTTEAVKISKKHRTRIINDFYEVLDEIGDDDD